MPDCAYTTLTVSAEEAERARMILEAAACDDYDTIDEDATERAFVWDDAPWGATYLADGDPAGRHGALGLLRDQGIAYRVHDGGHYTWDPYEIAWTPGMADPAERSSNQDGTPILDAARYRAAREAISSDEALLAWIEGHYGNDPARWTLPEKADR